MSDEERVRVSHEVPKRHRTRAQNNTDHGEMSERVREVYERAANPNDVTDREDINRRLQELRGERDDLKHERRRTVEELDRQIDAKETQIARLEERKDGAQSRADQFEGALGQLTAHVENGGSIWRSYPGVERAADTIGEPPEYVIQKVREQVPDAADEQFEVGEGNGGVIR